MLSYFEETWDWQEVVEHGEVECESEVASHRHTDSVIDREIGLLRLAQRITIEGVCDFVDS